MKARKTKSPGRRYRVIKRMPWIEGGTPAPPGSRTLWEGGKDVIYEPGDAVYVDDREVASIYHYLEAFDEAGRAILEEARAKAKTPAKITFVADFTPNDVEFLTGAFEEKRRAYGPHEIVQDIAVYRDGLEKVLSTRYVSINPLPGVVYDDNGLPDPWATALQRERWEMERKAREQRSRGQRNARANARWTEERNQAIAAYAVQLANSSDELADNPKRLADVVLQRWKPEWGLPLAPSTVRRLLKEQHVASTVRTR